MAETERVAESPEHARSMPFWQSGSAQLIFGVCQIGSRFLLTFIRFDDTFIIMKIAIVVILGFWWWRKSWSV